MASRVVDGFGVQDAVMESSMMSFPAGTARWIELEHRER